MMLTRDEILKKDDRNIEAVDVPEWGGVVYVRTLTGFERDQFEQSLLVIKRGKEKIDRDNMRARFLVRVISDEKGERLFNDQDADALGGKSAAAIEKLFDVAQRINGMGATASEEAKKS